MCADVRYFAQKKLPPKASFVPMIRNSIVVVSLILTACVVNPQRVTPRAVDPAPYFAMNCQSLGSEKARIEGHFAKLHSRQRGTRRTMERLAGEAVAVSDAIATNGCKIGSVRIPGPAGVERRQAL